MRIGVVHPGSMGVTVAVALRAAGHLVAWTSQDRSEATAARAGEADLVDTGTPAALVDQVDAVISVVPPGTAVEVARLMAACGGDGRLYVDANAVSPDTAAVIERIVTDAGFDFVDGGIVGPPATRAGTTRLYLAGPRAPDVAALFASTNLEPVVVGEQAGAASALKMAYAGWTKGSSALLMTVRALAARHGVEDALLEEWDTSIPGLGDRSNAVLGRAPVKAWRFVAEMEEIASTLAAAGLPDGFHRAAAEVFRRVGPAGDPVDPGTMLDRLLDGG